MPAKGQKQTEEAKRKISIARLGHLVSREVREKISKTLKKNPVKYWLKDLNIYDLLAPKKFIPEFVFKLKKEQIKLFLNRLFSCDGSIYYRR